MMRPEAEFLEEFKKSLVTFLNDPHDYSKTVVMEFLPEVGKIMSATVATAPSSEPGALGGMLAGAREGRAWRSLCELAMIMITTMEWSKSVAALHGAEPLLRSHVKATFDRCGFWGMSSYVGTSDVFSPLELRQMMIAGKIKWEDLLPADDDIQVSIRDDPPEAKKQRTEPKRLTIAEAAMRPNSMQRSAPIPTVASTLTPTSSGGMMASIPQRQVVTVAAAPTDRHPYPCRSRYHAKYSAATQSHGSRECSYCARCHLLEFLFNGCVSHCIWKHEPTARKISHHLSAFPDVRNLALQRFPHFGSGNVLEPYSIPLA